MVMNGNVNDSDGDSNNDTNDNDSNSNDNNWPKLLEPSQTKLTKMNQSNPKFTKINYITQASKNLVG